ncbi:MAG: hypothetical protein WBN89_14970 [Prochlorococcaceae cyanobacterium]
MEHKTTITTTATDGIKPGDFITLTVQDKRWWRRLWFFMLRRGDPYRTIRRRVSQVAGGILHL